MCFVIRLRMYISLCHESLVLRHCVHTTRLKHIRIMQDCTIITSEARVVRGSNDGAPTDRNFTLNCKPAWKLSVCVSLTLVVAIVLQS